MGTASSVAVLRFDLNSNAQRITYARSPHRAADVFRKTRMRETVEVERAHAAQAACEASHGLAAEHAVYSRDVKEKLP